ncbi:hypothetical protein ALNOE001_11730 [Candidatus Methanobinarius endosymbioticus]|uniref:Uncharacterized protein n=1 Tax=Candidatus Methanobinarius endosymbioticus TaxID=2006182 RepID=A0A366MBJ4_9EURY|nr:hypothetical protein ALNOE001_11730 [Candidatus Methanobinarius endosymbioticus]
METIRKFYRLSPTKNKKNYFKIMKNDFEEMEKDSVKNQDYIINLEGRNKNFYLNIFRADSFHELDALNRIDDLKIENHDFKVKNRDYKKKIKSYEKETRKIYSSKS